MTESNSFNYQKGFSSYISFSKYDGWKVQRDGPSIRVQLGWMSIGFVLADLENLIAWVIRSSSIVQEEKKKLDEERKVNEQKMESLINDLKINHEEISSLNIKSKSQEEDIEKFRQHVEELNKQIDGNNKLHSEELVKVKEEYENTIKNDVRLKAAQEKIEELQDQVSDAESELAVVEEEAEKTKEVLVSIKKIVEGE